MLTSTNSLGKFKRTLTERCGECETLLEIRVRSVGVVHEGMDILVEEEYVYCSNCYYERNVKPSKEKFDVRAFSKRNKPKEKENAYGRSGHKPKRTS